jgi:P-type Ca2+ transporter type 2C
MFDEDLEVLVDSLGSDPKNGLRQAEANQRLELNGLNVVESQQPTPKSRRFAQQFCSLMIGLLAVAAIVAGVLGDWIDTFAILTIVVLNALLGFIQEDRAERAMGALSRLSAPQAKAIRDGVVVHVPADQLVVGDTILVEAGDKVPADIRIVEAFGLHTQESSLTGESTPIAKRADLLLAPDTPLAERINCLFAGTSVSSGKAKGIVVATGMNTELGAIARLLKDAPQESTPLQRRLEQLSRVLVGVFLSFVAVIFLLQWLRGGELAEVFLTSVSLAVAAIPEGLPAVVTVALAIGLQRMAKRNALIRKLPSVETLGCVTVICSDKTGTLTRNEMTVRELWIPDQSWTLDGAGYIPIGSLRSSSPVHVETSKSNEPLPEALIKLLMFGDTCNNAQFRFDSTSNVAFCVGDPTEIALKVAASKAGVLSHWTMDDVVHENPFDSDRKRMSQVICDASAGYLMIVKGAPEEVLAASTHVLQGDTVRPIEEAMRHRSLQCNADMASQALRVLAVGFRIVSRDPSDWRDESRLTFVGLIGMIDPPRDEAIDAVTSCRRAGIRPVMITGDHPSTAMAISEVLGIASEGVPVLLGTEIDKLSDSELHAQIQKYSVIARVTALHKLRVVNAWKRGGHIVAMTGDGVNDAPAVKAADIGVVMGITDIVLVDDNFASIVNAVEEGRGIYENIRKVLQFLLACNASEVLFMLAATLLGWPLPLLAIQILWINLVTDGLPALALASEPIGRGLMDRPPRPVDEPILGGTNGKTILLHGLLMTCTTLAGFWWSYRDDAARLDEARAVAFCILTFTQIFYSMACRDFDRIMPKLGLFSNPLLALAMLGSVVLQLGAIACPWSAQILGVQDMPWRDLPTILCLSLIPVSIVEIGKLLRRRGRCSKYVKLICSQK